MTRLDPLTAETAAEFFGADYAGKSGDEVMTSGTMPTAVPCPLILESIRVVEYSLIELDSIAETVLALAPEAAQDGLMVVWAVPRVATNQVSIGIESTTTGASAESTRSAADQFLQDRLPPNSWVVELTPPDPGRADAIERET